MLPQGWARLVALLDGHPDSDRLTRAQRLCGLCVEAAGVTGVALGISSNGTRSTVCATDVVSDRLEDLQFTYSEGPVVDALRDGWAVLVSDLSDGAVARWPWFAPAAVEAGALALFVLPLQVGAIRLGSLSMYRASPGALTTDQHKDARVLAEGAALLLTLDDRDHTAEAFLWTLGDRSRFHAEVHQAVGALMVRLGVNARDAFARLCAYSYATDTAIAQVAHEIMAERLILEPD